MDTTDHYTPSLTERLTRGTMVVVALVALSSFWCCVAPRMILAVLE